MSDENVKAGDAVRVWVSEFEEYFDAKALTDAREVDGALIIDIIADDVEHYAVWDTQDLRWLDGDLPLLCGRDIQEVCDERRVYDNVTEDWLPNASGEVDQFAACLACLGDMALHLCNATDEAIPDIEKEMEDLILEAKHRSVKVIKALMDEYIAQALVDHGLEDRVVQYVSDVVAALVHEWVGRSVPEEGT